MAPCLRTHKLQSLVQTKYTECGAFHPSITMATCCVCLSFGGLFHFEQLAHCLKHSQSNHYLNHQCIFFLISWHQALSLRFIGWTSAFILNFFFILPFRLLFYFIDDWCYNAYYFESIFPKKYINVHLSGGVACFMSVSNSKNHYGIRTAYVRDTNVRMQCICIDGMITRLLKANPVAHNSITNDLHTEPMNVFLSFSSIFVSFFIYRTQIV